MLCEIVDEPHGFRRGRDTVNKMFTLKQLVEKRSEVQENMALELIDLDKAYT